MRGKCGGKPRGCPACVALGELRAVREECTSAINAALRVLWRVDSALVDRSRVKNGRPPKGKEEWKATPALVDAALQEIVGGAVCAATRDKAKNGIIYTYPIVRAIAPGINSGIASALARKADQRWRTDRFDVLVRQLKRPPHFTATLPIPIRAQEVRIVRSEDDKSYVISFNLRPGSPGAGKAQFQIPVTPRDAYQRTLLAGLVSGALRPGEMMIQEDRLRPGRWYIRVAYTKKAEPMAQTAVAVGINRGIKAFVAAVSTSGEQWLYDGHDIVAYLKQIKGRRIEHQRQIKVSNRGGHGRRRTLRPIEKLQAKGENWRKTQCQRIARGLAKWVLAQGAATCYLENFEGIRDGVPEKLEAGYYAWKQIQEWPYYQLQMRLVSCLEEYGITTVVVPASYISLTCPACGTTDEKNRNLRTWMFTCVSCGHKRHLDVNAAHNVLKRGQKQEPTPS